MTATTDRHTQPRKERPAMTYTTTTGYPNEGDPFDADGTLPETAADQPQITVTCRIENHYELHDTVTTVRRAEVPAPDVDRSSWARDSDADEELEEWAFDHLYPLTGTGRVVGDSAYFLTVTDCPQLPWLVGREFEWGT